MLHGHLGEPTGLYFAENSHLSGGRGNNGPLFLHNGQTFGGLTGLEEVRPCSSPPTAEIQLFA